MFTLKTLAVITAVVCSVFAVIQSAGCKGAVNSIEVDNISAGLYTVDYKIKGAEELEVKINGPAVSLDVVLTDPSGKTITRNIDKGRMSTYECMVYLPINDSVDGQWLLVVKATGATKAIWKKEFVLNNGGIKVLEAYVVVQARYWGSFRGFDPVKGKIIFKKNSKGAPLNMDGCGQAWIQGNKYALYPISFNLSNNDNRIMITFPIDLCMIRAKPGNKLSIKMHIPVLEGEVDRSFEVSGVITLPPQPEGQQQDESKDILLKIEDS